MGPGLREYVLNEKYVLISESALINQTFQYINYVHVHKNAQSCVHLIISIFSTFVHVFMVFSGDYKILDLRSTH